MNLMNLMVTTNQKPVTDTKINKEKDNTNITLKKVIKSQGKRTRE